MSLQSIAGNVVQTKSSLVFNVNYAIFFPPSIWPFYPMFPMTNCNDTKNVRLHNAKEAKKRISLEIEGLKKKSSVYEKQSIQERRIIFGINFSRYKKKRHNGTLLGKRCTETCCAKKRRNKMKFCSHQWWKCSLDDTLFFFFPFFIYILIGVVVSIN